MMETDLPPGSSNSTGHLSTLGYHTIPGRMHHSASTPAGVDGVGGAARTPPATPKKGGKMLAVRVQMLDDTISMFQVQSKALGKLLFEQVCRQLHLLEADYFGLEYQEANGTKYWLDMEKPLCRQVGLSLLEPLLRFCVKFYTPDPARLEEEFTRYLFCLQVKRDLALGCIQCNENTAALMASYIVQAECGDFVPEDYPDHSYLSGYKFFPGQGVDLERRIMENHKKHVGQSPAEADMNLLETARRCELYGMKMHPAKDHDNVPLNISVAHLGIVVFQNLTKINTFSWAKIRKISFKRKRFLIKLHPEGYGYYKEVVEFFFEGRNECKNFWKKCVENHGFFRCSSVKHVPRLRTRVLSRGSSFRYSGKTQKQIVEFVRKNYLTRQTFQRSGSFRASRSLRSSRANVAAPVHASLSAHPLLPLPPGSDAISLEWDKQPHYLEASLMMKGYTEEAAREVAAASRSGARRSSEGTARLPHAATTCATVRDKGPAELVTHAEVNHHPMEDSPHPLQTTTPLVSPESTWSQASSRAATVTTIAHDHSLPPHAQEYTHPDPGVGSPCDADTVSSGSFCPSPRGVMAAPLCTSTPQAKPGSAVATSCNGLDQIDNPKGDTNQNFEITPHPNGSVVTAKDNIVSESLHSIDVLSGGESDTYDTLSRSQRNNNSGWSNGAGTLRGTAERRRRGPGEALYFIAKELLMTERTYKSDLDMVTVWWSARVSAILAHGAAAEEVAGALGRPCLALEPLALLQGAFLVRLERCLAQPTAHHEPSEEPEYRRIAGILCDYLSETYDAFLEYVGRAGELLARLESARRGPGAEEGGGAAAACAALETHSPLPLACLLLRPLHRLLYYATLTTELEAISRSESAPEAAGLAAQLADAARAQLVHAENHATLCQLQRDITGYDKLLVAGREFLRLGCLYKHTAKGLQQRMLFLFSDVLVTAGKAAGALQFRAHAALPLHALAVDAQDLPHSFTLTGEGLCWTLSGAGSQECAGWCAALQEAIASAAQSPTTVDTDLSAIQPDDGEDGSGVCALSAGTGNGLAHVCWHRAGSLTRDQLHRAMQAQMSGYLLRKFKNSHGWQKLWVVFSGAALFFYKSWQDERSLASLPLLGYSVMSPSAADAIHKDFVFKLLFKNHVYFFRAESDHTFRRWTEVLRTVMVHSEHR